MSLAFGCPAACTSARVSLARASGMPGWSRMVLRFSRQNVTPYFSPSLPSRSRVRAPVVHMWPLDR